MLSAFNIDTSVPGGIAAYAMHALSAARAVPTIRSAAALAIALKNVASTGWFRRNPHAITIANRVFDLVEGRERPDDRSLISAPRTMQATAACQWSTLL